MLVAAFSFSFAWRGYRPVKVRSANWMQAHIAGMLGSYIAMTTALLVVNAAKMPGYESLPRFFWWILPTLIGTPLIATVTRRYVRPKV